MQPDFDDLDHASHNGATTDDGALGALSMSVARHDGQVVVRVRGELDMATAPALAECLERLSVARGGALVVDVSRLDFCDSSGLGVLVACRQRMEHDGAHLALREPSTALRRLLELTRLDDLVEDRDV